ncbi:aldehyde dehydrogenase [Pseudomarimonas arenosa]|uniref:Aldehyde dehydrogenase n=1 Tax=Pseudomarimonas arenosa TaxID=2774145 RepID=A0AAW3ZN29_9GAMM|nr:aldehyde dehydrogenase [Pseudomarimonas arenosa]MBD8527535.1 aldehyde dehydrogenase [Pseudomarimonas arenosa]
MDQITHWIDGQTQRGHHGEWLAVFNPSTGRQIAQLANGGDAEVGMAVAAAERAQPDWAAHSASHRAAVLNRIADAMTEDAEQLAEIESRNVGKPIDLCRQIEIPRAIQNLRFFAAAALQFSSESHHGEAGLNYTLRQPAGVVGCITPWNLPLYLFTWKIAPALAAGNAVIGKPSEITPLSAQRLAELSATAGLAPGLLNVVHGDGGSAGAALVAHPKVRAISFTGSTRAGRQIGARCGEQLKKASLELGGKNASIVFADAELDDHALADRLLRAGLQNSGQICLCGSRILIEASRYPGLRDALLQRIAEWSVGDPSLAGTRLGPLVSESHRNKVLKGIELAREQGGRILCGGGPAPHLNGDLTGWFVAPTLIEYLPESADLHREELFGPVITLQAFSDADDALRLANATAYGLAASVWTSRLDTAHQMAARLNTGIVWINGWMLRDLRTPFGGMNDSGVGREGGWEAMRFFTEARNICISI